MALVNTNVSQIVFIPRVSLPHSKAYDILGTQILIILHIILK
jgi:hypothetical protein